MDQSIEIEYKTLLSEEMYSLLVNRFAKEDYSFFEQTNVYFDTPQRELAKQKSGLRIRIKKNQAEVTLKTPLNQNQPNEVGLLETTQQLNCKEAEKLIAEQKIPTTGAVASYLKDLNISTDKLQILGTLKTKRIEIPLRNDTLLVLDESWYNGHHDYELEMEVIDIEQGYSSFIEFLNHYHIPYEKALNKVQRMMQTLPKHYS